MGSVELEFLDDISPYLGRKPRPTNEIMIATNGNAPPPMFPSHPEQPPSSVPVGVPSGFPSGAPPENLPPYPPAEAFMGFLPPPSGTSLLHPEKPYSAKVDPALDLNCREVDDHIRTCPICMRLHKSNANIFLGIIVVLVLICLFLGRKFFD